jgi:methylated-DNA-[protein]-cysteine S-methyltransferase
MAARETASLSTPIGIVTVSVDAGVLAAIRIGGDASPARTDHPLLARAIDQLREYFAGDRRIFDLPLVASPTPRGAVLRQAIVDISYGDVASYGQIARAIGSSPRALGQACARNPLPIIVPCHRVLGANHVLGAYSAGDGPATKQWLLTHEQGIFP